MPTAQKQTQPRPAARPAARKTAARAAAPPLPKPVPFNKFRPPKMTEAQIRERIWHGAEVDANFQIFQEILLPKLIKKHRNKFALLKRGEVVGIFPDYFQACDEGRKRYGELFHSVQEITDRVYRIGFLSGR